MTATAHAPCPLSIPGNEVMTTDHEQVACALRRANAHRLQRASVKRHLRTAGDRSESYRRAAAILTHPEPAVADALIRMPLRELLAACYRAGPVVVEQLLARARISGAKTIGQLTDRQREEIVRLLIGDASQPTLWEHVELEGTR
jgi:hypothetical protein